MINEQYARAKALLQEHKEGHNQLAQLLIDREVIFAEDVEKIFGKRPWASRSEEIMAAEEKALPAPEKQKKLLQHLNRELRNRLKTPELLLHKMRKSKPDNHLINNR